MITSFQNACEHVLFMSLKEFIRIWLVTYKPVEAMTAKLQNKDPMITVLKIPAQYRETWVAYSISD